MTKVVKKLKETTIDRYFPDKIEPKWQKKWDEEGIYDFKLDPSKENYYVLVELPYPSGDLHIGHWFAFTTPDVLARFKRMNGANVFFPHGYDAFGLPAENAAIKRNIHPKDWTLKNIETMQKQFWTMGTMLLLRSTTVTCLPEFYRWNQWIFLKMFEKGIAYRSKTLSNWCEVDQTVLANEHVENGKCWRCGSEVVQKPVEQWFLRITEYADSLIWENTEANKKSNGVDWPKSVKEGQNNWIGKSEGMEISFRLDSKEFKDEEIVVYTVYPETIFGVTYMVLAPENPLAEKLATPEQKEAVDSYIKDAKKKSEIERKTIDKEKTGVFTGSYCVNPVNGELIPIWLADYVIASYGTGAVMGVPGSDHRDFAFARQYGLPVVQVITRKKGLAAEITTEEDVLEEGFLINSGGFSGMKSPHPAKDVIKDFLVEKGVGKRKVQYHLHDWSISRQRYWGTPVPLIHCEKCGIVPVPEKDLPIELPYDVDYMPKGKPPLASNEAWLKTTCPECGGEAKRDAETLDTFFDSSWYYYRYVDPKFDQAPFNPELVEGLMPVNIYFGGAEHTLGHTLYARFFTKFFNDLGLVDFDEFALKRIQHGIVLGTDGNKMSKSKGNVINPDDIVKEFGADAVRIYLCFMMPYEATGPWSTGAMSGMFRFLKRVWELQGKLQSANGTSSVNKQTTAEEKAVDGKLNAESLHQMHKTIDKVSKDIAAIKLNTAIASLMEWLNFLSKKESISKEEYQTFILLLAPFAPHITEELWGKLQSANGTSSVNKQTTAEEKAVDGKLNAESWSIHKADFPKADEQFLVTETVQIMVQVNGKIRDQILVSSDDISSQEKIEEMAKKGEKAKKHLGSKKIQKVVYIPGKIISFVVV